jgi:hypothetical protein
MTPCDHVPISKSEAIAVQALNVGEATADQQKLAIKWIVEKACMLYDQSFFPGEEGRRLTDFSEGRRFVGNEIFRAITLKISQLGD